MPPKGGIATSGGPVHITYKEKIIGLIEDVEVKIKTINKKCYFTASASRISAQNLLEGFDIVIEREYNASKFEKLLISWKLKKEKIITTTLSSCRIFSFNQFYVDGKENSIFTDVIVTFSSIHISSLNKDPHDRKIQRIKV